MTLQPLQVQENAAAFAHTQASYANAERNVTVRLALELLVAGRPDLALYHLARGVERQNRILGGGTIPIEPLCPCGGRCEHGRCLTS